MFLIAGIPSYSLTYIHSLILSQCSFLPLLLTGLRLVQYGIPGVKVFQVSGWWHKKSFNQGRPKYSLNTIKTFPCTPQNIGCHIIILSKLNLEWCPNSYFCFFERFVSYLRSLCNFSVLQKLTIGQTPRPFPLFAIRDIFADGNSSRSFGKS